MRPAKCGHLCGEEKQDNCFFLVQCAYALCLKVDRSLLMAGGLLAVVMLGLSAHSFSLHTRQQALGKELQALELKLKAIPEQRVPSAAMLVSVAASG